MQLKADRQYSDFCQEERLTVQPNCRRWRDRLNFRVHSCNWCLFNHSLTECIIFLLACRTATLLNRVSFFSNGVGHVSSRFRLKFCVLAIQPLWGKRHQFSSTAQRSVCHTKRHDSEFYHMRVKNKQNLKKPRSLPRIQNARDEKPLHSCSPFTPDWPGVDPFLKQ